MTTFRVRGDQRASCWLTVIIPAALIVWSLSQIMFAQDYLQAVGTPVFTSAESVELGIVDASTGDLHLEIPVASFPQRAGQPLTYKFVYDSRIWSQSGGSSWVPNTTASPWAGWRFITSADMGIVGNNSYVNTCGSNPPQGDEIENGFYWQAPNGTTHFFGLSLQFTNHCGGTVQLCSGASASDNSGYYMSVNTSQSCVGTTGHAKNMGYTVIGPDGTQVFANAAGQTYEDSNGNYYSRDSNGNVIDTLGRTPVIVTSACGTNQTCYDVLNSEGTSRSRWIVTTTSISVDTNFPVWGNYSGNLTAIQSITVPDGTTYNFSYDSGTTGYHYGELTGMTLPTGGQVSYAYSVYEDALSHYNRWISQHTSGGGTTTYALGNINTTNITQTVTITKPSGDYKIDTFQLGNGSSNYYGAYRNSTTFYGAGGTLLQTISDSLTQYGFGLLPTSETVTLPTSSGSVTKQKIFSYADIANDGHPTTIKEWNYYSGSPAANPDRITNVTYLDQVNVAYESPELSPSGRNILTLPAKVQVTDGSSNLVSETDYSYDTTTIGSKQNIAQHDDTNYTTTMTTRGNRTQVQQLTNGTSYLTTSTTTYDQTGQLTASTDSNSNTTTYSYSDCFLSGYPPSTYTPPQATNSYLTSTTLPVSGNRTNCYYYNTGNAAWTKDQNGAQTQYFYANSSGNDPLDRLLTSSLPNGGWILKNYSIPATSIDTYTSIQTTSPSTSCTSCRHDQAQYDGLSRQIDQNLVNDPDGETTVRTDYDANGRVSDTSHPYRTTNDPTYGLDTYTYDGLNRVTETQHQDGKTAYTYYGAAVGTGGGETTQLCPQGTCHLGYPALKKDESGKMREVWTDGFGNVVEVDEPGAGGTGTTPGTGTVTIGGSEQIHPATAGSGSIVVSNSGASCVLVYPPQNIYAPQSGNISVTINGAMVSLGWGGNCNGSTETITPSLSQYISSLASNITNSSAGVTATVNGANCSNNPDCITLTAKTTGAGTNYSVSVSETWGYSTSQYGTGYSACCTGSLSGGTNGGADTGTVSVTIDGFGASYTWGATDSASTIASSLGSQLNSSSSPVNANVSGGTINITANNPGLGSNYSVSAPLQDTAGFSPSFSVSAPSSLTGGTDGSWGTAPIVTYYVYDLLGNLTQATSVQNSECTRSYAFDALSRLMSSTEPETGNNTNSCTTGHTTNYAYTMTGGAQCSGNPHLLCSSTDGRGDTITYSYNDPLNRLTGKTYSNGDQAVAYSYDQGSYNGLTITNGRGRRTGMSDGSGYTAWSYDANGNMVAEERTIAGETKTTSYAFNLDNSLKQLTYPSGRVLNLIVGDAQRVMSVIDGNGTQYALPPSSGWEYEPMGALASVVYGKTGSFGGIAETRTYNNRLQLTGVSATSSGGTSIKLAPGYNANGEIASTANNLDSGRTQTFSYDALSRITAASSSATSGSDCWGQRFTIDNVGNLAGMTVSKCSALSFSAAANQNNQFTGYTYDAAGNLTNDGAYTYAYNSENWITSANGVLYTYDGNGMRVEKSAGTLYWRDQSGNTIAESDLHGTDVNDYVFFAGRRIARIDSSSDVYYYQADQLGSTRAIVTSSGTLCYDADFTPYGQELLPTDINNCPQNYKFTGFERDSETGLDYAFSRYYNSRIGRFMSTDPSGLASATLSSPQSLNRYAYVLNNPLVAVDPLGLECAFVSDDGTTVEEVDATDGDFTDQSCVAHGGYFFVGNNDLNPSDWSRFTFDPDSNWVGLMNDNGLMLQAACLGAACGEQAYNDFAAANNGYIVVNGQYVFSSSLDNNYNAMEKGYSNFRDLKSFCSTHVTVDQTTGQTQSHVDLINPTVPFPAYSPVDLSGLSIPLHLMFDSVPDAIYRATGMYLIPAGRTVCQ